MSRKTVLWLYSEIPQWVRRGWLTPQAAEALQYYYGSPSTVRAPSRMRMLIVLTGVALLVMGVYFILSGYWFGFSPNGRFDWAFAFGILALIPIGMSFRWAAPRSPWREGTGLFYLGTIGMANYLVAITYPLFDPLGQTLFVTGVLGILGAYVTGSTYLVSASMLTGIAWGLLPQAQVYWGGSVWIWMFWIAGLLFFTQLRRSDDAPRKLVLSWALLVGLALAVFVTAAQAQPPLTLLTLSLLATVTYLIGRRMDVFASRPFQVVGLLGILYVVGYGSLLGTWMGVEGGSVPWMTLLVIIALAGLLAMQWKHIWETKDFKVLPIAWLPCATGLCVVGAYWYASPLVLSVLFDIYVFWASAVIGVVATQRKQVSGANLAGLAILLMVVARFVDPDFGYLERGLTFFVVGFIISVVNLLYYYQRVQEIKRGSVRRDRKNRPATTVSEGLSSSKSLEGNGEALIVEEASASDSMQTSAQDVATQEARRQS